MLQTWLVDTALSFFHPPEHLPDTTWDAHLKAMKAILESYCVIPIALSHLHSDVGKKVIPGFTLTTFCKKMEKLEFVFMLHFLTRVLGCFHRVGKAFQKSELSLNTYAELYSSLVDFLSKIRDKFDKFDQQARATLPNISYRIHQIVQ